MYQAVSSRRGIRCVQGDRESEARLVYAYCERPMLQVRRGGIRFQRHAGLNGCSMLWFRLNEEFPID